MVKEFFRKIGKTAGIIFYVKNLNLKIIVCPVCLSLPYLPVYKSTFQDLKISPKIRPRLIHGSKLENQAPVK